MLIRDLSRDEGGDEGNFGAAGGGGDGRWRRLVRERAVSSKLPFVPAPFRETPVASKRESPISLYGALSSAVRAARLHRVGRRFEPVSAHHKKNATIAWLIPSHPLPAINQSLSAVLCSAERRASPARNRRRSHRHFFRF